MHWRPAGSSPTATPWESSCTRASSRPTSVTTSLRSTGPEARAADGPPLMDIVLQGMVFGIANGLLAVGLVLVFMSNRTINFAQGEFGALTVAVMFALTNRAHLNY